jgi:hypothetical protein
MVVKTLDELIKLRKQLIAKRDRSEDLYVKSVADGRKAKVDYYEGLYARTLSQIVEVNKKIDAKSADKQIYCGAKYAKKPKDGKRLGDETECKKRGQVRLYGKTKIHGGSVHVTDKLIDHLFENKGKVTRNVKGTKQKKGGSLAVKLIRRFIQVSKGPLEDVGDYKVDRSLSGEWVRVYYNKEKNQAVVVHRGSADAADAWTDVKLFFQQTNNERFKVSEKVQKEAENKYGAANVTTLGSSLGGYLAEQYGQGSKEVITVSKPTTFPDLITGKKKGKNQHDIRTTRDSIAILQNFQKGKNDIVIPSKTFNPVEEHLGDRITSKLPQEQLIGEGRLKKMKVKELKVVIKSLRKGKAKQYPITNKKKLELLNMVKELERK